MSSVFVTLVGGSPWGFRLQGGRGTGQPLTLSKVSAGGRACRGGLREGDVLRAVGGRSADGLTQGDVQEIIGDAGPTLTLQVHRKAEKAAFDTSSLSGHSNYERKPLSTDHLMTAPDGHLNDASFASRESAADEDASKAGRTCDFTHCLRPSEIRNNSFMDKISFRSSPDKSPVRSLSPVITAKTEASRTVKEAEIPNSNGQCDFGHCLKPSQVQNSSFLIDITARNLAPNSNPFASNSSQLAVTKGQFIANSSFPVVNSINEKCEDVRNNEEASHKSEITIVLQNPYEGNFYDKQKSAMVPPVKELETPFLNSNQPDYVHNTNQRDETVPLVREVEKPSMNSDQPASIVLKCVVPPPPPLPSSNKKGIQDSLLCRPSSAKAVPQNQPSRLAIAEPAISPSKSPVMMELEKCFEARRRHSADELDQRESDQHLRPGLSNIDSNASPERGFGSNDNSFELHPPPTAVTYQYAGSRGSREHAINGGGEQLRSPTIVTAPPPGAVLLDERVSVDAGAGLRHTDRLFGLPVREVLRESTRTAHFRPAPPKYEGIGPTEDGMPIAPRNSVKKEHMHDWYKTMYKSLHKADSSNDNQEYIIGYSSEPETSKKERSPRKKASTLDSRSGSNCVVKGKDYSRPSYEARPRLIEDYEPGHSSVTDNDVTVGHKRYLPALNTPKASYEYTKGYEQESRYTRNLSPDSDDPHQGAQYAEVQRGGEVPRLGLGRPAPEKPAGPPAVGPLPPPPVDYTGPAASPRATRPLTLPPSYQTKDGVLFQPADVVHTELQQNALLQPSACRSKSPSRSPDLKIPARVLFDFKAESAKELPLRKDDVVLISRQLDRHWYEGEQRGRSGIFPLSYVEIVPPEHAPLPPSSHGSARMRYDFTAHASVELSARKGDSVILVRRVDANWYEARLDGRKGIVPSSYLHVTREPAEKSALSPCLLPSPSSSKDGRPGSTSPMSDGSKGRTKKNGGLIEPVMYRALYAYSPLHSDELELREGESVCVVERCDDGWFVGAAADSGRFGIFPGNYVQREEEN